MIIRVNDEFLDFDADIEIERQAKLFEDITANSGDYSYTFSIPSTSKNRDILGVLAVMDRDNRTLPSQILNDSGVALYYGQLYIDRVTDKEIECTFYSGNSDWITILKDKKLSDLVNREFTITPETQNNPVILPIIDNGLLAQKGSKVIHQEDLLPTSMAKDVVRAIFNQSGLKVTGDIFNDPVFNSLAYCHGKVDDDLRTTNDSFTTYSHTGSGVETIPFSTFTADRNMTVDIDFFFKTSAAVAGLPTREFLLINGTTKLRANSTVQILAISGGFSFFEKFTTVNLAAGDTVIVQIQSLTSQTITDATLEIRETNVFRNSFKFPDEQQTQFLSDVLTPFNVVIDYNSNLGEVEINLFKNIAQRETVDLSNTIESVEVDYSDFISNYSKINTFKWSLGEEAREYNDTNENEYGSGQLDGDNINLSEGDTTVFESELLIPYQYQNSVFEGQLGLMNLKNTLANETKTATFSSVSNSSGTARFALNSVYKLKVGDQVLITESDLYNGLHVVESVPVSTDSSHSVEFRNLDYLGNDSGEMDRVKYSYSGDSYLFLVLPVSVTSFLDSTVDYYSLNSGFTTLTNVNFGYAILLEEVGSVKNTLSFGQVNGAITMRTMLDNYWADFSRIITNGIGLRTVNYISEKVFSNLKFKNNVRINTDKFSGLFYLNRVTGYKGSSKPCEVEFIKI